MTSLPHSILKQKTLTQRTALMCMRFHTRLRCSSALAGRLDVVRHCSHHACVTISSCTRNDIDTRSNYGTSVRALTSG